MLALLTAIQIVSVIHDNSSISDYEDAIQSLPLPEYDTEYKLPKQSLIHVSQCDWGIRIEMVGNQSILLHRSHDCNYDVTSY